MATDFLAIEGFDHTAGVGLTITHDHAAVPLGWHRTPGAWDVSDDDTGYDGEGRALRASSTSTAGWQAISWGSVEANLGFGFHFTTPSLPSAEREFLIFAVGRYAEAWTLSLNTAGDLIAKRGATTLGTASAAISASSWHHIEIVTTIANSGGAIDIYVNGDTNGTPVLSLSSIDTFDPAISKVGASDAFIRSIGVTDALWDNVIVRPNATRFGEKKVGYVPVLAEGVTNQFSPSTGTDRAALVDHDNGNDTAIDHITGTPGQKQTFTLLKLDTTVTALHAFAPHVRSRKSTLQAKQMGLLAIKGASEVSEDAAASTDDAPVSRVMDAMPDGSAMNQPNFNQLEVGIQL